MKHKRLLVFAIFLVIIIILISVLGLVILSENKDSDLAQIGGDRDEHGCLAPAGYSWCLGKNKCLRSWEEPCNETDASNNIENLIDNLELASGVSFSDAHEVEFVWQLKNDQVSINGYEFVASAITPTQYGNIEAFYNNTEFMPDLINNGFVRNGMHCINSKANADEASFELTIKCGYPNDQNFSFEGSDRVIKDLFVNKYKINENQFKIEFTHRTDTHVRGVVTFLNGFTYENSLSNTGVFLSAKVDNKWKLIYDGNGSYSCKLVNSFNFPDMMIKDCY